MKRTAFAGLFITAALLASPVFAADDLCDANLQTIKDARTSASTNLSTDTKAELAKTENKAIAEKDKHTDAGTKECIALTTKAISELKLGGDGSDGAAAK